MTPDTRQAPALVSPPEDRPGRPLVRAAILLIKLVLFCLVLVFIGRELVERFRSIRWSQVRFHPSYLGLTILCEAAAMSLGGVLYCELLRPLCRPPPWPVVFAITFVSRLGKYLPGKFASVLGAVWLLHRHQVPVSVSASAIFLRQGLLTVVGLLMSAPLTLWRPVRTHLPHAWVWCMVLAVAVLICLHPRVFFGLANLVLRRLRLPVVMQRPRLRQYVPSLVIAGIASCISGVGLWSAARSVTGVSPHWMAVFMCGQALAGTIGFLAVFAPGGLGVREGILLVILDPILRFKDLSAVVAVVARIAQIATELVLAGVGLLVLRGTAPRVRP